MKAKAEEQMTAIELFNSIRDHADEALNDLDEIGLDVVTKNVRRRQVARALAELKAATYNAERFLARF